jgi:hypothetical protein
VIGVGLVSSRRIYPVQVAWVVGRISAVGRVATRTGRSSLRTAVVSAEFTAVAELLPLAVTRGGAARAA